MVKMNIKYVPCKQGCCWSWRGGTLVYRNHHNHHHYRCCVSSSWSTVQSCSTHWQQSEQAVENADGSTCPILYGCRAGNFRLIPMQFRWKEGTQRRWRIVEGAAYRRDKFHRRVWHAAAANCQQYSGWATEHEPVYCIRSTSRREKQANSRLLTYSMTASSADLAFYRLITANFPYTENSARYRLTYLHKLRNENDMHIRLSCDLMHHHRCRPISATVRDWS